MPTGITYVPNMNDPIDVSISRDYACAIDREDTDGDGTLDRDIVKCWGNTPTVPDLDRQLLRGRAQSLTPSHQILLNGGIRMVTALVIIRMLFR